MNTSVNTPLSSARHADQTADKGLLQVLLSFRSEIIIVAIFSLVINLLMLTPTVYMLQIYDRVLASKNTTTLLVISGMILFFFLIMMLSEWARSIALVLTSTKIDQALSERVFRANLLSYLHPSKQSSSKTFSDLTILRQFLAGNGVFVFFDLPWIIIYLAVLFLLHPVLGYWAMGFAVVQTVIAVVGYKIGKESQTRVSNAQYEAVGFLQSKLLNIEMLASMGMLGNLFQLWRNKQTKALVLSGQAMQKSGSIGGVSKFVRYAQQTMSLAIGAWLVIHGEISAGAMIAGNFLMSRALAPIDMLTSVWPQMQASLQAYSRLSALLSQPPLKRNKTLESAPIGAWNADEVTVRVEAREAPLLNQVSIKLKPGTLTVVMGPSGSGKSTLARVMLGIWPGHEGTVTVADENIGHYTRESLGSFVGYLPQGIELFDGTIAENIARIGNVDSEKVIEAAKAADLHQMILQFPQGYDSPVGADGMFLSGGQRQRVGLARVLYGQPQLIVLDEPNANLDEDGENALMNAITQLRANGRIILMISHRGSVIDAADQIIVLQDGKVAAAGTPSDIKRAFQPVKQN